eukprot:COSAG01_NODE_880_length_12937_cov_265.873968_12_plen_45_part_00
MIRSEENMNSNVGESQSPLRFLSCRIRRALQEWNPDDEDHAEDL